ncbi:MAG: DNA polymerase I [Paracoccaceae bacterium]|nr:DNA polymerase I [Paracoccaceae bacterium]
MNIKKESENHLHLIDGSGFIFRAYYALPPLTRSDGLPVGAVAGFCNMIYKLMKDNEQRSSPSHIAIVFDHKEKTFRSKIYPDYKKNRSSPPEDLIPQFDLIREATRSFGLACIERAGYEADDIIATYAEIGARRGWKVTIISSDKDLMQLVSDRVTMLDTMKNRKIGPVEVKEKFGVTPNLVIDVQALAGDSIDNIPGATGIGIKTASLLINQFGSLEELLDKADQVKQPKRREALINERDKIRISKELVTLCKDVPLEQSIDDLTVASLNPSSFLSFIRKMEFRTLSERLKKELSISEVNINQFEIGGQTEGDTKKQSSEEDSQVFELENQANETISASYALYEKIVNREQLEEWIIEIEHLHYCAIDVETTSLDELETDLVGISLATKPGKACYIPLGHTTGNQQESNIVANLSDNQLPSDYVLQRLKTIFENPSILKIGQNIKFDLKVLRKNKIFLNTFEDTMLMSYALHSGLHRHGLDFLSEKYLSHNPIPIASLIGSGSGKKKFSEVSILEATQYASEDADITIRLWNIFRPMLSEKRVTGVYKQIELDLVSSLAQMELNGILVDRRILENLSKEFGTKIDKLEGQIFEISKEKFNVGSPKQLGSILFDKLGIKGGKKGKTGSYTTDAEVLETLAAEGHLLPEIVLQWRQLSKLRSTYTEALQNHIKKTTGRVHSSFLSSGASTGRLSSTNPNLQNIPIRTEDGRKIREAFIAPKGKKLISFDYSQIELRILAHIARIQNLKKAFLNGQDIHSQTASEVFQVSIENLTPELRRQAKAINFGVIYGISPFGLANNLRISREMAKDFIEKYFQRYPGIQAYMDWTIAEAKQRGYVRTLFGRKIHTPNMNSKGPAAGFAKRSAINAPIQGSAADIIKMAMINIPKVLKKENLIGKMILQVHDELLFEVPDNEVELTLGTVTKEMENACHPFVELDVPLKVDVGVGVNWNSAH